jgi:acyl-coenzyme A synthetase/AMP-(fatty) acid ligase
VSVLGEAGAPLLAQRDLDAPLAWREGRPLSGRRFLADVAAQAAVLPAAGPAINLHTDRYRFAVAFGAALLRGHASLFPPNALPETLAALRQGQGSLYALADDEVAGLPTVRPVHAAADSAVAVPCVPAGLVAACLLTSGSTGVPQPHEKRWSTLLRNAAGAARRLAEGLERPSLAGLNIVATVPPQHSYGFESSVLPALLAGAAFDAGRPFYPADIADALARLPAPRALVTTPFHLKTLLLSGVALPPVALLLSATAPLSPQLAQAAERATGGRLIEIYGCTEAGQVATRRTAESELWHTFDGMRVRLQPGAAECFVVQGGHVDEPTPLADILELVDEQHFRLLGRANDLVHVAGKRSSLGHLNYHLNSIPGVDDGAFWLPPEPLDGVVRTVAFVVTRLAPAEVQAALRQRIEPAFVPRRIVVVDALPREATGKLTEQSLRRLAAQHFGL